MTTPAITCHVNDTLADAARRMRDHVCGAVVVVDDDGKLTAMLTDRDICMAALLEERTLDQILVNNAMTGHAVCVKTSHPIGYAEELMARHHVRRLPVVDADYKPIGVISIDDVARDPSAPISVAKTLRAIGDRRPGAPHTR